MRDISYNPKLFMNSELVSMFPLFRFNHCFVKDVTVLIKRCVDRFKSPLIQMH